MKAHGFIPVKNNESNWGANGFIVSILKINKHNQTIVVVTSSAAAPTPG